MAPSANSGCSALPNTSALLRLSVHLSEDPVILCQPCNQSNFRQRSADPIRQPAEEGRVCPDAVEREPCNLNRNCFHYDYNVTGTWTVTSSQSYSQSPCVSAAACRVFISDCAPFEHTAYSPRRNSLSDRYLVHILNIKIQIMKVSHKR